MNIFRTLHRSILMLFAVVVVSIVTLVHISVSNIVAEQSRAQQQSHSPALQLIVEQLMQPLHISQTLAKAKELQDLMRNPVDNEDQIFTTLKRLNSEFSLNFFIASEISRTQYDSEGKKIELTEGKVDWYFRYKAQPEDAMADIGQWQNPQFYIDLKIYDDENKFLGVFGVGKSLKAFTQVFSEYKKTYGYDFIFVDQNKDITLTSDPELLIKGVTFKNLADLPWFQALNPKQQQASLNNLLLQINGQEALIAELNIQPFDWTLYIITPLQSRQTEISRGFIISIVTLLAVIFGLFLLIYNLLYYFKKDIQKIKQIDILTELANRSNITLKFEELMYEKKSVSLVLIDLDNFKPINETHGRKAGDIVLRQVAQMLQSNIRDTDILGRWGGEEFLLLMQDTGPHEAVELCQELCKKLAAMTITTGTTSIQITGSFGVSFTATPRTLSEVITAADDALFSAKRDGRNMVRMQLIESD
ncbi:sensor domain-containing diguanylate cyclase [uncultured Paraglaciecola sp.]|uniref:sensor domain-containing diguanylate cyclase n=1 Tax=uncultured Paraglaciecola sp. TaxID=1765024 RepID=UPI0025CD41B1|nr:sensor domain-containing diguanylate cyclase [uncultured Paraglaciecola sp.]